MGDPLAPGALLANRYRVSELLGRGGMGLVYAARDERTGLDVAVKLLRLELRERMRTVSRFQREARALAQLSSPHVVRVTDVDALPDGTPFFVMDRLEGRTLATELELRGSLPIGEAMGYVVQAALGAQAAHARGIVHRDLKPENLFLVDEGAERIVKVLDFGISKLFVAAAFRVTETDTSLGTPAYMSPEQLRSAKHVDARSDVWSLGVIAYELLTGRLPFGGSDSPEIARAIVHAEARPIRDLVPEVPLALAGAVERALRKDPADRPRNALAFARTLEPFAAATALTALPATSAGTSLPARPSSEAPRAGDTHRDTRDAKQSSESREAASLPSQSLPSQSLPSQSLPSLLRLALLGAVVGVLVSLALHYLRRANPF
jgi:eukaryotic-like serine/threonine-protein kinase